MKLEVVAVFDNAIKAFGRPVFVTAVGAAMRGFGDEVNKGDGDVSKHPEDFELFHLGSWDDSSGKFSQLEQPVPLAMARNLVVKE